MIFAGVLDFLNDGGGAIIGVIVIVSLFYLFGLFKNEVDRCTATHPRHGRCRLKRMHRTGGKHTNWNGKSWY